MIAEAKPFLPPSGPHSIAFRGGPLDGRVEEKLEGVPLFTYKYRVGKRPWFAYHNSYEADDQGRSIFIPKSEYCRKPGHPRLARIGRGG